MLAVIKYDCIFILKVLKWKQQQRLPHFCIYILYITFYTQARSVVSEYKVVATGSIKWWRQVLLQCLKIILIGTLGGRIKKNMDQM